MTSVMKKKPAKFKQTLGNPLTVCSWYLVFFYLNFFQTLFCQPPDKKTCDLLVTMVTTDPLSISLDSRQYSDLCPETVTSLWPFVMLRLVKVLLLQFQLLYWQIPRHRKYNQFSKIISQAQTKHGHQATRISVKQGVSLCLKQALFTLSQYIRTSGYILIFLKLK